MDNAARPKAPGRIELFAESPAALTFRRNEPSDPLSAALLALSELKNAQALPPVMYAQLKEMLLAEEHETTIAGLLAAYDVERDSEELRDSLARFGTRLAAHGSPADFTSYRPPVLPPQPAAEPPAPAPISLVPTPPSVPVRAVEPRILNEDSDDEEREKETPQVDEALPFPALPPLRDAARCASTQATWTPYADGNVHSWVYGGGETTMRSGGGVRIAIFGWEGTLVSSGVTELLRPTVMPPFIRALSRAGYTLIVADHARGARTLTQAEYEDRTHSFLRAIGAPLHMYLSVLPTYRPPSAAFIRLVEEQEHSALWDRRESFAVGSGAGRSGDRSAADRTMARQLRIPFRTPEELWDGAPPAPFSWTRSSAAITVQSPIIVGSPDARTVSTDTLRELTSPALVLLIGAPASGKTLIAHRYFTRAGWSIVPPIESLVTVALKAGHGVLVDGAPPNAALRAPLLQLAAVHRVPAYAILLGTSEATAVVLSKLRIALGEAKKGVARSHFNGFKRAFQPPMLSEGFVSVLLVPFSPSFDSPHAASTYSSLLG